MSAYRQTHEELLNAWKEVLVFRIGEDDTASLTQLPDVRLFPTEFPVCDPLIPWRLGLVFGVAVLKLCRPWAEDRPTPVDMPLQGLFDPDGDYLLLVKQTLPQLSRVYQGELWDAMLKTISETLGLALRHPQRLAEYLAWLDCCTNRHLQTYAHLAVQGHELPDNLLAWWFGDEAAVYAEA